MAIATVHEPGQLFLANDFHQQTPAAAVPLNGSPRVEELTLPKYVETGKLSLSKAGIRWMSV